MLAPSKEKFRQVLNLERSPLPIYRDCIAELCSAARPAGHSHTALHGKEKFLSGQMNAKDL